jgi:hypothetical protein
MTAVMRQDKSVEPSKEDEPAKPEVPPASETWVEGQPESDADYQEPPTEPK